MAFFVKRKSAPTDVPVVHDISKAQIDSPKAIVSTKAPPPSYSVTDVTTKSSPSTLEPTTSNVYSPDEFTGAIRQPTVSGENMVVARHQATPVNDGQLPEVVVHSTGNTSTTQSLMSESHLSLNTSSMTLQEVKTVTPLHLLGDQSDYVDCPFCRRRVETRVQKDPSTATQ